MPTTDPEAAVLGMLLPAAGHKGFGLALMIDVLTGVLSGGGWGDQVRPLYREPDRPNDCAHLFLAIDPELLGGIEGFRAASSGAGGPGPRQRDRARAWTGCTCRGRSRPSAPRSSGATAY